MAPHRNPSLPNIPDDRLLSTRRAGEVAARATGHVGAYHPSTVRAWADKGLEMERHPESGRHRIRWGDLKSFLGSMGMLAVAGEAGAPAAVNPRRDDTMDAVVASGNPAPVGTGVLAPPPGVAVPPAAAAATVPSASFGATPTPAVGVAAATNPHGRLYVHHNEDLDDMDHDELETFRCPKCGEPFSVTPNTLVASCPRPRCGEEIDLAELEHRDRDNDDDDDDELEDDEDDREEREDLEDILDDLSDLTRRVRRLRAARDSDDGGDDEDEDDASAHHHRRRRNPAPLVAGAGALKSATLRRGALRAAGRFVR